MVNLFKPNSVKWNFYKTRVTSQKSRHFSPGDLATFPTTKGEKRWAGRWGARGLFFKKKEFKFRLRSGEDESSILGENPISKPSASLVRDLPLGRGREIITDFEKTKTKGRCRSSGSAGAACSSRAAAGEHSHGPSVAAFARVRPQCQLLHGTRLVPPPNW